jgi:Ni/Co efflux regulator RcnB
MQGRKNGAEAMKRRLLALAAVVALAGPLSGGAAFAREGGRGEREAGHDRGEHRGWNPAEQRGWDRGERRGWDRGDGGRGGERRIYRGRGYEAERPDDYQPPPSAYRPRYARPSYAPGRRGGYLPDAYRGRALPDYGRYRLRPPPRGYAWYRVGESFVLVDQYTGQVFDVID